MKTDEFWKSEGLSHIIPNTGQQFPEGFNVHEYLHEYVGDKTVVEIGCGYGRLCESFSPAQYTGYDINPSAIEQAKQEHPQYTFILIDNDTEIVDSDFVMFYTVALHISDEFILEFLEKSSKNSENVLIAEILGRKWRRKGNPPVFNRELSEYTKCMEKLGFTESRINEVPYKRYPDTNITFALYSKDKL
jgi:SAM-dependent methyltransferase